MSFAAVTLSFASRWVFVCMLREIRDFVVADLKEQHPCIQFCFKLVNTASETLTIFFGDSVMDKTQTSECFFLFKLADDSAVFVRIQVVPVH